MPCKEDGCWKIFHFLSIINMSLLIKITLDILNLYEVVGQIIWCRAGIWKKVKLLFIVNQERDWWWFWWWFYWW